MTGSASIPAPASLPGSGPLLDARAARLAQGLVALLVAAAALLGAWPLLGVPALHLVLSAALGRRGNLPVRAFDAWIRPRLAPGAVEDARPPRFASTLGAALLGAALLAHAGGAHALGWALALPVAALAALAAATGFCLGCRLYWALALVRRLRA